MEQFKLMDNFKEEIVVKRNRTLDQILYGFCWISIVAVSYTHLDVYKRQTTMDAPGSVRPLIFCSLSEVRVGVS